LGVFLPGDGVGGVAEGAEPWVKSFTTMYF